MASHAFALLGLGRITIEVRFHPVVNLEAFATRKALSEHCRSVVADGVSTANAGRVGDWEGAGGAAPVPVS
jgi:1-acyl-sn-glycerol-3-phosphate acyltransferase